MDIDTSDIEKEVAALYELRDHDFSLGVKAKEDALNEKEGRILGLIGKLEADNPTRGLPAKLAFLKGRTLNIGPTYNEEAQKLLSKAVKLDPSLLPAWNSLGDAFWKKRDFDNARNCFVSVLDKDPSNLDALCGISMVLRQVKAETVEERKENVEQSVGYAKEAVAKNMGSSSAWYVLGNSYLSSFFMLTHNPADLKKALNAYNFAEAKSKAAGYAIVSPDLLSNRATVFKFRESYQEALDGFRAAMAADPTLTEAVKDAEEVVKLVVRVADLIQNTGKLKPKKLKQLCATLTQKQFIPENPAGLKHATIADLVQGTNEGRVINVRVVAVVSAVGAVPLICVAADKTGQFCAVSVYNVPSDAINFNDQLTIIAPERRAVSLNTGDQEWTYTSVTVHAPSCIVKNRVHELAELFAETKLSLETGTG